MARDRQTSLRLDGELLERLQEAAKQNRRTLGAEISLRLEQSFQPSEPAAVLQQIAEASKVLADLGSRLVQRDEGASRRVADHLNEAERRVVEQLNELEAAGRILWVRENPNPYAEADAEAARKRRTKKEKV